MSQSRVVLKSSIQLFDGVEVSLSLQASLADLQTLVSDQSQLFSIDEVESLVQPLHLELHESLHQAREKLLQSLSVTLEGVLSEKIIDLRGSHE